MVIHPENQAQQKALQIVLDGLKVPCENESPSDATDCLLFTEANMEWLNKAMQEAKDGKDVEIKTADLWK